MQTEIVALSEKRHIAVVSHDDVEAILERCNRLSKTEQVNTDGFFHRATVPNIFMVKWLNEEWQRGNMIRYPSPEFNAMLRRKLDDPEYAYLNVGGPRHMVGFGK